MISAVVLTKNEEKNIRDCLNSLQWCDEIIVIDDYSNDKTVQIAKKLGAKVFRRCLENDFAAQRNFGLKKAKGKWVLFVDADECVSEKLRAEINNYLTHLRGVRCSASLYSATSQVFQSRSYNGFYLKRRDYFGGRWLKHGETANVELLRLARKSAGKWVRKVHETWSVKKRVGKLNNSLLHYPHPTISDFLSQVNFYSTLHADALYAQGVKSSLFRIIAYPLGKFCQNYFLRLGFLDGIPGLVVALMMSFHSFLARGKLYKLSFSTSEEDDTVVFYPPESQKQSELHDSEFQTQDPKACHPLRRFVGVPRCFLGKAIAILLFCYFVLFPFGQLGRIPLFTLESFFFFPPLRESAVYPEWSRRAHSRSVLGPEIHLYLTDLVLLGLLGTWGIWRFWLVKKKYQLPRLAWPIFSFSIISLLSLGVASPLLEGREVFIAGLYWLRWAVYAGFYFVLTDLKNHFKWLNRKNLLNFLVGIGVMVAILGLVQYFLWPNLRPLEELEWDPHYYRVVGTFLDPGFTGLILALTMILIVESFLPTFHLRGVQAQPGHLAGVFRWPQFLSPRRSPGSAWPPSEVEASDEFSSRFAGGILAFSGIIVYFVLALTYSRASYLAYIVGIAVISWVKRRPKLFWGALLLGILTLIALPRPVGEGGSLSRTYSIEARIKNWQHSIIIAKDHPVLGVGFNAYRYIQRDYGFWGEEKWQLSHSGAGADSSLLFVLATTGAVGLGTYLWIWIEVVKKVKRVKKGEGEKRTVVLASLAVMFAHSWFLNSLFYPWIMAWVWVLLATESN